jgi:hypothetical protein
MVVAVDPFRIRRGNSAIFGTAYDPSEDLLVVAVA